MTVEITFKAEIKPDSYDEVKRIVEHHLDWLADLNEDLDLTEEELAYFEKEL